MGQQETRGGHAARGFVIVGVGISAGALEAVEGFFSKMPPDSGSALVIVPSNDHHRSDPLTEVLGRHTPMCVREAVDGLAVEANQVYVIAPGTTLAIEGGKFRAASSVDPPRMSIDEFFCSLAEDQGENAVGIILSGTGADGATGLQTIKRCGGLTIAQSPQTVKCSSLPRCSIETGLVDYVLPVEEIPAQLVSYAQCLSRVREHGTERLRREMGAHLNTMCALLEGATGHDFSRYKEGTLLRRIQRRMQVKHIASAADYAKLLEQNADEVKELFKDLLIGVTCFFRDPEAFEFLGQQIIPKLFEGKAPDAPVRIWAPACASGEEPYSIAILVQEYLARCGSRRPVQIFATDIDERLLLTARKACYSEEIVQHVSPQRLERFFTCKNGQYQVCKEVRETCIFSSHNLIKDPPFSSLDLISCRNLFIYLEADIQARLVPLFHYTLRAGGYLFLGPSEGLAAYAELFAPVEKRHRIFRCLGEVSRPLVEFPLTGRTAPRQPQHLRNQPGGLSANPPTLCQAFEQMVLEEYAPPCVVVNEQGDILCAAGHTGRFLQLPGRNLSANILDLATGHLRLELRTALYRAVQTRRKIVRKNVTVEIDGETRLLRLTVRPLPGLTQTSGLFAVILQEVITPVNHDAEEEETPSPEEPVVQRLEAELRLAREDLQVAVEELESANEELRASNEELTSTNEELQSTNEELQTSQEKLQSVNEELETVNDELNQKVRELDAAASDLQNLFASTRIATIFLDRGMRIKKFTPAATALFRLLASDVGRPITDLAPRFLGHDLAADVQRVFETLATVERQVHADEGRSWFMLRVLPYRATGNVIAGVVVTFIDITPLKNAEQATRHSEERYRSLFEGMTEGFALHEILCDPSGVPCDYRFLEVNPSFERLTGLKRQDVVGRLMSQVLPNEDPHWVEIYGEVALTGMSIHFSHYSPVLKRHYEVFAYCPAPRQFAVLFIDITARKQAEEKQRQLELQMLHTQKLESLGVLAGGIAHDFNNILAGIMGYADLALVDMADPRRTRECIDVIKKASRRAADLTRQMLDYSGKGRFVVEAVILSQLVEDLGKILEVSVSKKATLQYGLEGELPAIKADATQLRQVVMNLVINASESLGDQGGAILVTVSTRQCDGASLPSATPGAHLPAGTYVCLEVADTGCGMAPETLERIFEPFFTTKFTGRGLGLAAVQGIVRGHGGAIQVASRPGQGTTFTVLFPAAPPTEPATASEPPPAVSCRGSGTVLIVDDEEIIRKPMRLFVEDAGFKALMAADGQEAIDVFRQHQEQIVCVILDLTMPKMSGEEVFRELRRMAPDVRIILTSGCTEEEMIRRFADQQVFAFLEKPMSLDLLIAKLRTSLATEG